MKAPEKLYVEVCEDGIFAFPEPPFAESVEYIRADLVKQPAEGLEEEIEEYYGRMPDDEDKVKAARHFAEWQKKIDDLETADLLAIAHMQGMEQQKGNIKNLLKSWAENELDEHPNKNDDFRLAIYSLIDKLNDL